MILRLANERTCGKDLRESSTILVSRAKTLIYFVRR
jgi:hypothetical protein